MTNRDPDRTRTTFLRRLRGRDGNEVWNEACRQFDTDYRPVVTAFARSLGLDAADADEVAQLTIQDALNDLSGDHPRFDKRQGRLRYWVYGIAKRRVEAVRRARATRREHPIGKSVTQLSLDDRAEKIRNAEWRNEILCQALSRLRTKTRLDERTITAFLLVAVYGHTAHDVAASLRMTAASVHLAKHRCLNQLRKLSGRLAVQME